MRVKMAHQENKEHVVARAQTQPQSLLATAPGPLGVATSLLNLQHTYGNRFVQRMLMATATIQRQCACGGTCTQCQSQGMNPEGDIFQQILQRKGSGQPLDTAVRVFMETRFGQDFSSVRLHTDAHAARTAQQLSAVAYTVGRDIFFGESQYQPHSQEGRRLLAHELTHVLQQGVQPAKPQTELQVSEPGDRFEQEAERVADAVMAEKPAELCQQFEGIAGPSNTTEEEYPFAQDISEADMVGAKHLQAIPKQQIIPSLLGAPALQRTASFAAGAVHAVNNTAVQIATGGPAGITLPMLNGANLTSTASARAAIRRPTLTGRSTATGVECWVDSVPTNTGSFDETVLNSGPWSTVTPKVNVALRLGLPACAVGGNATLTANGRPSDADVAKANRTHEDHHAADHRIAFNSTIGNWDTLLTAAWISNQIFSGPDVATCEASLYAAMGGTPESIADDYFNSCLAAGAAFHATPAGGPLAASNPASDATCGVATVEVRQ